MDQHIRSQSIDNFSKALFITDGRVCLEFDVVHVVAGRFERVPIAPHRGKEQDDLLLMMPDVGTKPHVLGHEDGVRL